MARVLVAMSGGVDSSVAAYLLLKQGHDCVGVTMLLHNGTASSDLGANTCCSLNDVEDAREVASALGIPHHTFDFTEEFERDVVDEFVSAYESGLTPNPCVVCNRRIKFGALLMRARELGCDFLATGHYARVVPAESRHALLRARDASKDQSYFLCLLTQRQLGHVLFPLGNLTKKEVRAIAEEQGFVTAHKRESQDVCFVPDGDYLGFLERRRGHSYPSGDILDTDGAIVGRHRGAVGYTIGQRKGLGVSLGKPAYVCAKDMEANTITVGSLDAIMANSLVAKGWNWISEPPAAPVRAHVRTHYRQRESPATVVPLGDGSVRVDFDEPQRAIAPGQFAVAYNGDAIMGGGQIEKAL